MERGFEELRGGAVPSRGRLAERRVVTLLACALAFALAASRARAELGRDLERLTRALAGQARSEALRLRLMERGDITPVVLPPWSLDRSRGECTTLVVVAPIPTQFLLHVHPWSSLPSVFASQAGALQLTRCGQERSSLLQVFVEMRSPRAVVYSLVAVGSDAPPPLMQVLPERDVGPAAPLGDPGPLPAREPLAERLREFEQAQTNLGATNVGTVSVFNRNYKFFALQAGCHRLLASGNDGTPYTLLLRENKDDAPERLSAAENGDLQHELCTARGRQMLVSLDTPEDAERRLSVASFPLPNGLPRRFGPELIEHLVLALGGAAAPRTLGPLVAVTLGAQGRTPLPRSLRPQTCYLAAASVVHGAAQALSLGVRAGPANAEATSSGDEPGPHLGFCTRRDGHVELDVEARGLGLAWAFFLFQMGPARPAEAP